MSAQSDALDKLLNTTPELQTAPGMALPLSMMQGDSQQYGQALAQTGKYQALDSVVQEHTAKVGGHSAFAKMLGFFGGAVSEVTHPIGEAVGGALHMAGAPLREVQHQYRYIHDVWDRHGPIDALLELLPAAGIMTAAAVTDVLTVGLASPVSTLAAEAATGAIARFAHPDSWERTSDGEAYLDKSGRHVSIGRDMGKAFAHVPGLNTQVTKSGTGWLPGALDAIADLAADPLAVAGRFRGEALGIKGAGGYRPVTRAVGQFGEYGPNQIVDVPIGLSKIWGGLGIRNVENAYVRYPRFRRVVKDLAETTEEGKIIRKYGENLGPLAPRLAKAQTPGEVMDIFRGAAGTNEIISGRLPTRSLTRIPFAVLYQQAADPQGRYVERQIAKMARLQNVFTPETMKFSSQSFKMDEKGLGYASEGIYRSLLMGMKPDDAADVVTHLYQAGSQAERDGIMNASWIKMFDNLGIQTLKDKEGNVIPLEEATQDLIRTKLFHKLEEVVGNRGGGEPFATDTTGRNTSGFPHADGSIENVPVHVGQYVPETGEYTPHADVPTRAFPDFQKARHEMAGAGRLSQLGLKASEGWYKHYTAGIFKPMALNTLGFAFRVASGEIIPQAMRGESWNLIKSRIAITAVKNNAGFVESEAPSMIAAVSKAARPKIMKAIEVGIDTPAGKGLLEEIEFHTDLVADNGGHIMNPANRAGTHVSADNADALNFDNVVDQMHREARTEINGRPLGDFEGRDLNENYQWQHNIERHANDGASQVGAKALFEAFTPSEVDITRVQEMLESGGTFPAPALPTPQFGPRAQALADVMRANNVTPAVINSLPLDQQERAWQAISRQAKLGSAPSLKLRKETLEAFRTPVPAAPVAAEAAAETAAKTAPTIAAEGAPVVDAGAQKAADLLQQMGKDWRTVNKYSDEEWDQLAKAAGIDSLQAPTLRRDVRLAMQHAEKGAAEAAAAGPALPTFERKATGHYTFEGEEGPIVIKRVRRRGEASEWHVTRPDTPGAEPALPELPKAYVEAPREVKLVAGGENLKATATDTVAGGQAIITKRGGKFEVKWRPQIEEGQYELASEEIRKAALKDAYKKTGNQAYLDEANKVVEYEYPDVPQSRGAKSIKPGDKIETPNGEKLKVTKTELEGRYIKIHLEGREEPLQVGPSRKIDTYKAKEKGIAAEQTVEDLEPEVYKSLDEAKAAVSKEAAEAEKLPAAWRPQGPPATETVEGPIATEALGGEAAPAAVEAPVPATPPAPKMEVFKPIKFGRAKSGQYGFESYPEGGGTIGQGKIVKEGKEWKVYGPGKTEAASAHKTLKEAQSAANALAQKTHNQEMIRRFSNIAADIDPRKAREVAENAVKQWLDNAPEGLLEHNPRHWNSNVPGQDPHGAWAKQIVNNLMADITKRGFIDAPFKDALHFDVLDDIANGRVTDLDRLAIHPPEARPGNLVGPTHTLPIKSTDKIVAKVANWTHTKIFSPMIDFMAREPMFHNLAWKEYNGGLKTAVENGMMKPWEARMIAQQRASFNMSKLVHNLNERTYMSESTRNWMPFLFAETQAFRRAGQLLIDDPGAFRRFQLASTMLMDIANPQKGEDGSSSMVFPLEGFMTKASISIMNKIGLGNVAAAVPIAFTGTVQSLGPVFPLTSLGDPEVPFGPLAAISVKAATMLDPALVPVGEHLIGSAAMQQSVMDMIVPNSTLRGLYHTFTGDHNRAFMNAQLYIIQDLSRQQQVEDDAARKEGRVAKRLVPDENASVIDKQDFVNRVKNQTRVIMGVRAILASLNPTATSAEIGETQFRDEVRSLVKEKGLAEGMQEFLTRHPDATPYTVFTSEANTQAPLSASSEVGTWMANNMESLKNYAYGGAWLIPQAKNTFDQGVYNEQLAMNLRQRKAPDQYFKDIQIASSNNQYYAMKDEFDKEMLKVKGDKVKEASLKRKWTGLKQAFGAQNPIWFEDYQSPERRIMRDNTLADFRRMIADPAAIPPSPQFEGIKELVGNYDQFVEASMPGRTDAVAKAARASAERRWDTYLDIVTTERPELRPLVLKIFKGASVQSAMQAQTAAEMTPGLEELLAGLTPEALAGRTP